MLQYFWGRLTPCCSLGPCYIFIPFIIWLYNTYLHVYVEPYIKPIWDVLDPYIGDYVYNRDSTKSTSCCKGEKCDESSSEDEEPQSPVVKRKVKKAD